GKRLVPTGESDDDYPETEHAEAQETAVQLIRQGGDRIVRRRFLLVAAAGAAGALGVALLTPLGSLGPLFSTADFFRHPWRRGRAGASWTGRATRSGPATSRRPTSTAPSRRAPSASSSGRRSSSFGSRRASSVSRRSSAATTPTGSSRSRRSAPTPGARSPS